MTSAQYDSELHFLEALHAATESGAVEWKIAENDDANRESFVAEVGGSVVEIEFVYFERATGGSYEKLLARVSGLKTHFHVAVGTRSFDTIASMLSLNIFGWQDGRAAGIKGIEKATERVRKLAAPDS